MVLTAYLVRAPVRPTFVSPSLADHGASDPKGRRRQKRNLSTCHWGARPTRLCSSVKLFSSARIKRAEHLHVHRILLPTSVTIASRPSKGSRMRGEKHGFRKIGR